jgi:hypothetical protein
MRSFFLGLAAAVSVLAACSSKLASPDGGGPNVPDADANVDHGSKIPGADGNVDLHPFDCGSIPAARGMVTWDDSSSPGVPLGGDGTATLRSAGGTELELAAEHREGTVSGVTWTVTATLLGGNTLWAGTYVCGEDVVAGYIVSNPARCWSSTPTVDCPGLVASCTFTLADQIWPGCFENIAKGTFSLTLTGADAGTVTITNGTFDVPIVEPVPPN